MIWTSNFFQEVVLGDSDEDSVYTEESETETKPLQQKNQVPQKENETRPASSRPLSSRVGQRL